jgi:hypothetical protein
VGIHPFGDSIGGSSSYVALSSNLHPAAFEKLMPKTSDPCDRRTAPASRPRLSDHRRQRPPLNEHRFLDRLARGDLRNVRFTELCKLVKALGFEQRRL